ncbi:MAG: hypothetical protein FWH05_03740 [Oscillospiraceae bacterium]|nr:hypothetical protein [Oscillospiraceae bacterium]
MAILMCRDIPVYDIKKDEVLSEVLCPFTDVLNSAKAYKTWRTNRAYLKTNRIAEQTVKQAGGFHTREAKRRLSLSDSFWIKHDYDSEIKFDDITPYLNPFSEAYIVKKEHSSSSVPELVLGGSQPKKWGVLSEPHYGVTTFMSKIEYPEQVHAEMLAVKLAKACNIPAMNAFVEINERKVFAKEYHLFTPSCGVINLINMTSTERTLIQFDQLGIGVSGYNPTNIIEAYKKAGVSGDVTKTAIAQIIFDGVIGNIDRKTNNSNWAIFSDTQTGKRTPSHLYDFNWANLENANTIPIKEIVSNIKKSDVLQIKSEALSILKIIADKTKELGLELWRENALNFETLLKP